MLFDLVMSAFRTTAVGFVRAPERINVAMTRAKYLHITICDLSTLNDAKFLKWVSQQDPETQADAIAIKQEQNKYLKALFDFYESNHLTCLVRPNSFIEEFNFIDMTEAEGVLADLKLEDEKSRCNRCGSTEHRASSCEQPKRPKCKQCGGWDHIKADCEEVVCKRCGEKGHMVPKCPQPDPRPCARCSEIGHFAKQCPNPPRRRLKFTVPAKASKTAKPKLDESTQATDTPAIIQWDTEVLQRIHMAVAEVDPSQMGADIAAEEGTFNEDGEEEANEDGEGEAEGR